MLPGGISQSFAYDNTGRLVDSKTRRSAEQRRSRHYRWGSSDRLLSIEDDRYGLTQYSYSPSGELTMATYADGRKEYRLSDKVGNLYNDPDKKLRKYLEGGRIKKSGEWAFKYDKDGQLIEKFRGNAGIFGTKKDRWEYRWTQTGMLEGVCSPHRYGQWTRFTYDTLGRRLTKLGDVTFHYLWNGNVPLHEWRTGERYEDGGLKSYSEVLKTWLFEEESFVPLALIQDGKAYSIVCDQLGTPTEAYDEEDREVWYRRLDMNGKILEETQPGLNPEGYVSIPFLFQGQYYDYETGLAYNRFRYYDPELGRYISEDPIRLASGVFAIYGYVGNTFTEVDYYGLSSYKVVKAKNRRDALIQARDYTKVPRQSRGGVAISIDELHETSRGREFSERKSKGVKSLGARNGQNPSNYWMEHPDGHIDAGNPGIPEHHGRGHLHSVNTEGEHIVYIWE